MMRIAVSVQNRAFKKLYNNMRKCDIQLGPELNKGAHDNCTILVVTRVVETFTLFWSTL